jgi:iron uptake system component EfeO
LTAFRPALARLGIAARILAGCGTAYFFENETRLTGALGSERDPASVAVSVTASNCEPSDLDVPAGTVTFSIRNASSRALEWEILDGVMMISERENIAPGSVQSLTVKLTPGDYRITCGLLSNPTGTLHVAGLAGASIKPSRVDLIGPLAEYRVYASYEIDGLVEDTRRLADALKSGDLNAARTAYTDAHAHYARIASIAVFFPDLDGSVDDQDKGQLDPSSPGFHPLKSAIFFDAKPRDYGDFANKLVDAVVALQARFESLSLTPAPTFAGAVEVMGGMASEVISSTTDGPSNADLSDVQADVEGVRKMVDLFRPLIAKADSNLGRALDDDFAAVDATLARYRNASHAFEPNTSLSPDDRIAMQNILKKLSSELSQIPVALGFG